MSMSGVGSVPLVIAVKQVSCQANFVKYWAENNGYSSSLVKKSSRFVKTRSGLAKKTEISLRLLPNDCLRATEAEGNVRECWRDPVAVGDPNVLSFSIVPGTTPYDTGSCNIRELRYD